MSREAREDVERYIREHATDYFQRDRSGKGYICPICGSGGGVNGTGITENPKSKGHFTCWGGNCFQNADIFEIIGRQFNLTDFNEIFNKACELFRVTVNYVSPKPEIQSQSVQVQDFTDFYKQAVSNLSQTNYYRGISLETLKKFHVGFIPDWRAKPNAPVSPRLIIPVWSGGYLARDTRPNLTEQQAKYSKMRVGKTRLFNPSALKQNLNPVFIVEGELDALSIIDVGGQAVGLGSIANIGKLIEAVKAELPKVPLIIQLDNDLRGQQAEQKLIKALKNLRFFSYRHYSLPETYKDANEFLMTDRVNFKAWVKYVEIINFTAVIEENQNSEQNNLHNESGAQCLNDFADFVLKINQAEFQQALKILINFLTEGYIPDFMSLELTVP